MTVDPIEIREHSTSMPHLAIDNASLKGDAVRAIVTAVQTLACVDHLVLLRYDAPADKLLFACVPDAIDASPADEEV